jgi:hypothetical protein
VTDSYLNLRHALQRRDKSLREKVVSLDEAASFVKDGDSVGVGGSMMSRTPMALIWALIRAGRKNLTCSRSIVTSDGDLLLGSGISKHIITSWFSQGILWGVSKVMRHHVETGAATFEEWSHMAMGMRFRAGAMGLPFMPIRSMLGSDVLTLRPEAKEMDLPVHRRQAAAGAGAQPRRRHHPCAALRRLRQCSDRRPAIHGHRPGDGRQQASSSRPSASSRTTRFAAHRTRPRFRSSASMPWSRCHTAVHRTNATAPMSR